jgi:O-Antigen ligase
VPVWSQRLSAWEVPTAVTAALSVTAISFAHGGYFAREWGWALLAFALVSLLAVLARDRLGLGPLEVLAIALLAAFTGWTALSTLWSVSAAQPLLATERTLVYAVALPAVLLVTRSPRGSASLVGGVIVSATAVCGYALLSRFVPGTLTVYPRPDGYQLQEPIGYWNGLAILAAIGAVATAGMAAESRTRTARTLAAAALPLLVTALYFTFSRGGVLALAAGVSVALVVTRRRLHLLAVLVLLVPASAMAVWYASRLPALTHAGSSLSEARSAGWRAGTVVVACSAVAAAVGFLLPELERRARIGARAQRLVGAALIAAIVLVVLAVLVRAGGPSGVASRLSASFNRSLPQTGGDLNRRLTSFSSDGRADYWRVAWREVRAHPLLGGGSGSYERYWHRYRPTAFEAQNAHNLYLETLAELGPIGLALLLATFAVPFVSAARNRAGPGVTAGAGAFAAFAVHAAVDWDFQIVAVALAGLFCAAALLAAGRTRESTLLSEPVRVGTLAVLVPLAALAIAIQVGNSALADATAALERGDGGLAARLATRARTWQPWSYQPWQLLGEEALAAGRRADARTSFEHGLARDRAEWSLWYDLAQASSGPVRAHALTVARRLNPQAPELTP